jgi:hypothetical protein
MNNPLMYDQSDLGMLMYSGETDYFDPVEVLHQLDEAGVLIWEDEESNDDTA